MNLDQVIPAIFLIAVLILVLPAFIKNNFEKKIIIKNLSIWGVIILLVMIVLYYII